MSKPPAYNLKNIKEDSPPSYKERITVKELRIKGIKKLKEERIKKEEEFYQEFKNKINEIDREKIKNYIENHPFACLFESSIEEKYFNKNVIKRYNKDKNNIYKLKHKIIYSDLTLYGYEHRFKCKCYLKINDKLIL